MQSKLLFWIGLTIFSFVGTYALHASNVQQEEKKLSVAEKLVQARREVLLQLVTQLAGYMDRLEEQNISQEERINRMKLTKNFCEGSLSRIRCEIKNTFSAALVELNRHLFDQTFIKELEEYYHALNVMQDLYDIAHIVCSPGLNIVQQLEALHSWLNRNYLWRLSDQRNEMRQLMNSFEIKAFEGKLKRIMLEPKSVQKLCEALRELLMAWPSKSPVSDGRKKPIAEAIKLLGNQQLMINFEKF